MSAAVFSNTISTTLPRDVSKDNRPTSALVNTTPLIKSSTSNGNITNNINGNHINGLNNNTSNTNGANVNRSSSHNGLSSVLVNRPSLIEYKQYRFLIMDAPTENNIHAYIDILKKKNVIAVVRACEPTYSIDSLLRNSIRVLEAPFPDGDPPSDSIINEWLALVRLMFNDNTANNSKIKSSDKASASNGDIVDDKKAIAVHCVAGLGRAPVLVAIALIEAGMPQIEVIDYIRKRRRGAFNSKQLKYIQSYKARNNGGKKGDCTVM